MSAELILAKMSRAIGCSYPEALKAITEFAAHRCHGVPHKLSLKHPLHAEQLAGTKTLCLTIPIESDGKGLHSLEALADIAYEEALVHPVIGRLMRGEGGRSLLLELVAS